MKLTFRYTWCSLTWSYRWCKTENVMMRVTFPLITLQIWPQTRFENFSNVIFCKYTNHDCIMICIINEATEINIILRKAYHQGAKNSIIRKKSRHLINWYYLVTLNIVVIPKDQYSLHFVKILDITSTLSTFIQIYLTCK